MKLTVVTWGFILESEIVPSPTVWISPSKWSRAEMSYYSFTEFMSYILIKYRSTLTHNYAPQI